MVELLPLKFAPLSEGCYGICISGILLLVLELLPFPMMRAIVAKGIEPADQGTIKL